MLAYIRTCRVRRRSAAHAALAAAFASADPLAAPTGRTGLRALVPLAVRVRRAHARPPVRLPSPRGCSDAILHSACETSSPFAPKCTSWPIPPPTLRERLSTAAGAGVFGELVGAALVRELHVYGQLIPTKPAIAETSAGVSDPQQSQHVGFGTRMMLRAEAIALEHGFRRMAVISGVGAQSWRRYGKVDRLWRSTAVHA